MNPTYAKREQRFSAEGGRKPKWSGGSEVKDGRRGGSPCLHKRGFLGARKIGGNHAARRRESFTSRGTHPRLGLPRHASPPFLQVSTRHRSLNLKADANLLRRRLKELRGAPLLIVLAFSLETAWRSTTCVMAIRYGIGNRAAHQSGDEQGSLSQLRDPLQRELQVTK